MWTIPAPRPAAGMFLPVWAFAYVVRARNGPP